jgi:hypothetical protein
VSQDPEECEGLTIMDLLRWVAPSRPYPLPGGSEVHVWPLSCQGRCDAARLAADRMRPLDRRFPYVAAAGDAAFSLGMQLGDLLEACRVGSQHHAPPLFRREDAPFLAAVLPWRVVREVATLSEQLGKGEVAGEKVQGRTATPEELQAQALESLKNWTPPSEPHPLPDGQEIRVRALSFCGVEWVNVEGLTAVAGKPKEQQDLALHFEICLRQAVEVCHVGPERDAPRLFERKDLETARELLGWEQIRQICEKSDRVGKGADALGQSVANALGIVGELLEKTAADLTPKTVKATRERLLLVGGVLSRVKGKGALETGDLLDLRELK